MCINSNTTKITRARMQAFTLIEVTIALAIMAMMAGVIYALVEATLRGTAEVEQKENRLQEFSGMLTLCRNTFNALPANATFEVRMAKHGEKQLPELIFRNAPGILQWTKGNPYSSTILGVRPQVGGQVALEILQDQENEISVYLNGGEAKRPWLVLMPNLKSAEWRFYGVNTAVWVTEWHDATARPLYAELTLATENGTERFVFQIPRMKVMNP